MFRTWTCPGLKPVEAHTKGEARALFKRQLREAEALTFAPRKITRLPARATVKRSPHTQPA
jgi:hypothetical protein